MKDLKISKELIKAVLEKETETLSKDFNFTINEDYIEFSDDGEMLFEYCIYKFSFKCKEWAMNKGFQIISGLSDEPVHRRSGEKAYAKINHYYGEGIDNLEYKYKIIKANTEVEAVIKASEYVLKEKNYE